MTYAVNSPQLVQAGVIVPKMRINTVPINNQLMAAQANSGGSANLTVNDSATLAGASGGNAIISIPLATLAALPPGTVVNLGTTANGLVVSSVPPSVGVLIDW